MHEIYIVHVFINSVLAIAVVDSMLQVMSDAVHVVINSVLTTVTVDPVLIADAFDKVLVTGFTLKHDTPATYINL